MPHANRHFLPSHITPRISSSVQVVQSLRFVQDVQPKAVQKSKVQDFKVCARPPGGEGGYFLTRLLDDAENPDGSMSELTSDTLKDLGWTANKLNRL